jgi:hypothetical protein
MNEVVMVQNTQESPLEADNLPVHTYNSLDMFGLYKSRQGFTIYYLLQVQ